MTMLQLLLPYAVTAFAFWCAVNVARSGAEVIRELFAIGPAPRSEPAGPVGSARITPRQRAGAPLRQAA